MKKVILALCAFSILMGSAQSAFADCREQYAAIIEQSKEKQTNNTMASVGVGILLLAFPPAGIAKGASLLVRGGLSYRGIKIYMSQSEMERIVRVIDQAEEGNGEDLQMVLQFVRMERPETNLDWVAKEIARANASNAFCTETSISSYVDLLQGLGVSEETAKKSTGAFGELLYPNQNQYWNSQNNF